MCGPGIICVVATAVRYRTNAGAIFSLKYHLSEATVRRYVESQWVKM